MIEFYFGYIGIVKMKVVVRFYVWWFKFDEVIEEICKVCFGCRSVQNIFFVVLVYLWNFLLKVWYWLYIDFVGLFQSVMFLIVVDVYLKWLEIFEMKSIISNVIINILWILFVC